MDAYLKQAGDDAELSEKDLAAREAEKEPKAAIKAASVKADAKEKEAALRAFGGAANIIEVAAVGATRLLAKLNDPALADPDAAQKAGLAISRPQKGVEVHLIVGPDPERYLPLTETEA
jgi:phosphotransferase system IIB component